MEVPHTLWGEVVSHVVYVLNRVSTKALMDTIPYEMWTGRKPPIGPPEGIWVCCTHDDCYVLPKVVG